MSRRPLALANWKMAMTVAESLSFLHNFQAEAREFLDAVDVVICPPFTSLWPMSQALRDSRIQLGGQNMAPSADIAHTGQISAALLFDTGCRWVQLGHWEVRRHLGDDDAIVNRKLHLALATGLMPILLIGEGHRDKSPLVNALEGQLASVLAGCGPEQVKKMAFEYEPEGAIGVSASASLEHVWAACEFIRGWLRDHWGEAVAERVQIIYGGSVTPECASDLLTCPEIDGLAAARRGREATSFAEIIRLIAEARTR